ncbi:MAG: hypothetical protein K1X89_25150 [Myxococcaceae bacterium]|nr:hypothetical protein [Myxococcaceae bacterium]
MATTSWSTWVKWDGSIEKTLAEGQHVASGELSVAEVRQRAGGKGTASILDVVTLDDRAHLGRCWVLGAPELHRHFGSKTPPRKAIEAGREAFLAKLEPGQAVAVTAYSRGMPSVVLFAGRTDS